MDRRRFLRSSLAAAVGASVPQLPAWGSLAAAQALPAEIAAVGGDGEALSLLRSEVDELAQALRGNLLLPGADGYDMARRVLNSGIDRHPALVVQPTGVADIQDAVRFANDHQLLLAVKCGGHSFAGKSTCDGGLQIDLSTFRHARVDPSTRTAHVAGGSLLGELDREAMAYGMVTTAGTVSHTGVGGLTLGGGFGRLARKYGLSLDNVHAVDVVTADGSVLHANAEENEDLYWGLRGGGGNFGVVTNFEFGLHPAQRQVIGGEYMFPLSRARDVLSFYADFVVEAPDDVYCDPIIMAPMGGGDGFAGLHVCYSGPEDGARRALAPIDRLGEPLANTVRSIDYVAIQSAFDNSDPRNEGQYVKGGFINEFPQSLVDTLMDGFEPHPERSVQIYMQHSGGAIGRVAAGETAFAHRRSIANLLIFVSWPLDIDGQPHIDYIRSYFDSFEKYTDGWYTNEVSNEPQRVVNSNYQGNLERLVAVKNRYDPGNLFRLNANIRPTA